MNVSGIGPSYEKTPPVPSRSGAPGKPPAETDSVSINGEVGVPRLMAALKELPETRPDKLAAAARRIAEGYYDDPAVLEKTAETILGSGALDVVV